MVAVIFVLAALPTPAHAQAELAGEAIHIARTAGPISIDGDLSDQGWQHAARVDKWYEAQPGDNTEPKVKSVGYLAYDDRFLYAAFEFEDPNSSEIRAPFVDRDNIGNDLNDYGGILIDPGNTGTTGVYFVVSPRNIQYDSITNDASGAEDPSPDFFWDSATRITANGWTLEMRIPFSSLRYRKGSQTWRILLQRNYARDFHYKFNSVKIPRGSNCFVCRTNVLTGLANLPTGGHLVAAPYVNASGLAQPSGELGTPLVNGPLHSQVGLDAKFLPNADNAIDVTVKPDFSQVESDTAQIAANERFALFFPEKRPFFLEGVDLLATPIQAVYTRTITAPEAGARITGKGAGLRYTVLVADDKGGGSAVLPGPMGSSVVSADFGSTVFIARAKRPLGLSFVSVLATDREHHEGQGYSRVLGPDFQWRPAGTDVVSGQWLVSETQTPNRPELAGEWDGRRLAGHAGLVQWQHNTTRLDWISTYKDISSGFRADAGFVPQVGFREISGQTGWTFRPTGFLTRVRPLVYFSRQVDESGKLIGRALQPGLGMDTKLNGFMQVSYVDNTTRTPGGATIGQHLLGYYFQFSPSRLFGQVVIDGRLGQDVDVENSRPGSGATVNLKATVRPTDHLEVELIKNRQWLNVNDSTGLSRKLFTADVSRAKGTYTFTSRLFVRTIAQYASTDRDPSLYIGPKRSSSGDFSGSLLVAYKLNWQSVIFVGYGDNRTLTEDQRLERLDRQFFVKMSYAFQH